MKVEVRNESRIASVAVDVRIDLHEPVVDPHRCFDRIEDLVVVPELGIVQCFSQLGDDLSRVNTNLGDVGPSPTPGDRAGVLTQRSEVLVLGPARAKIWSSNSGT